MPQSYANAVSELLTMRRPAPNAVLYRQNRRPRMNPAGVVLQSEKFT
jgi:hypothetical protein